MRKDKSIMRRHHPLHHKDALGFEPLMDLRQSMDHLFEDFFSGSAVSHASKCNVYEDKDNFHIELQVPGMSEKELDVSLDGHVLTIKGESHIDHESDDKNYHRVEFAHTSINRAWELPPNVDVEKLQANFKHGILDISIPKRQGSDVSKKIEIKTH
ncbi:MAG: Hsp20/alpha crystallin family protein [Cellvibrionales bacterium]|nr:Hsp20/alpha crystallin family protein [Cellvibrionales bacterium]